MQVNGYVLQEIYYSKRINELENKSIWKDLASSCFKQL